MPVERSDCLAGLVTYPDGKQGILVAGGVSGTDVTITHFINLETLVWEIRADLPYKMQTGASVPFKDSFLIVGGWQNNTITSDRIWYYNPVNDKWEMRDEILMQGRSHPTAFLVPDDYIFCS